MYGLLTEPGEQSAEFTIYGSYRGMHKWVVVQINLRKALGKNQSIQFSSQSVHPCIHLSVLQASRQTFLGLPIRIVFTRAPFIISVSTSTSTSLYLASLTKRELLSTEF